MPLSLAGRVEVLELLGRYAHAIDSTAVSAYHDTLRRTGGRWRFQRREVFIDPRT